MTALLLHVVITAFTNQTKVAKIPEYSTEEEGKSPVESGRGLAWSLPRGIFVRMQTSIQYISKVGNGVYV